MFRLAAALAPGLIVASLVAPQARALGDQPVPPPAEAEAAVAEPDPAAAQKELCEAIETAAEDHELPVGFFTRLLWKESRFRADAVSPKGAQGIAQFMPGTAAERGLADPFDARTAIPASASYLADLGRRFGNLGLAAAAYNAGPQRVDNWLAETSTLPFETHDFVLSITGIDAATWADPDVGIQLPAEPDEAKDCLTLAALLRKSGAQLAPEVDTAWAPWGVQVAGNFSRAQAIAAYSNLGKRFPELMSDRPPMIVSGRLPGRGTRSFYRVRVPVETRTEGEAFCTRLKASGASCIVLKS
jgi:hypothetical protein